MARCWIGISMYALRKGLRLSRSQMGKELGIDWQLVALIEQGDKECSKNLWSRLDWMYENYLPIMDKWNPERLATVRSKLGLRAVEFAAIVREAGGFFTCSVYKVIKLLELEKQAALVPAIDIPAAIAQAGSKGSQSDVARQLGVNVKTLHEWVSPNSKRKAKKKRSIVTTAREMFNAMPKTDKQSDLARRLGVSVSTVSRWKNGSRNPKQSSLMRMERMKKNG